MKSTYSIWAFLIPRSTITTIQNQTLAIFLVCIGNDLPVLFAEGNHFKARLRRSLNVVVLSATTRVRKKVAWISPHVRRLWLVVKTDRRWKLQTFTRGVPR